MGEANIKLEYPHSKGWLIFWVIVFFPVALVLLLTGASFKSDGKTYYLKYSGSRNWLCFWTIFCFPLAFVLLLLNGITLVTE